MKNWICTVLGAIGGVLTTLIGGWDMGVMTLIVCMSCDYIFGLIVAGVFHKSKKTTHGGLESRAGWKGICRKICTIMLVAVGSMLDNAFQINYLRNAVIIGFTLNEVLSIIENLALMGVPMPSTLKDAIDVLKDKTK